MFREGLLALLIGLLNSLIDIWCFFLQPGQQRRAEAETDLRIGVNDLNDPIYS